jgi:hypothetical protein
MEKPCFVADTFSNLRESGKIVRFEIVTVPRPRK